MVQDFNQYEIILSPDDSRNASFIEVKPLICPLFTRGLTKKLGNVTPAIGLRFGSDQTHFVGIDFSGHKDFTGKRIRN